MSVWLSVYLSLCTLSYSFSIARARAMPLSLSLSVSLARALSLSSSLSRSLSFPLSLACCHECFFKKTLMSFFLKKIQAARSSKHRKCLLQTRCSASWTESSCATDVPATARALVCVCLCVCV